MDGTPAGVPMEVTASVPPGRPATPGLGIQRASAVTSSPAASG